MKDVVIEKKENSAIIEIGEKRIGEKAGTAAMVKTS